MVTIEQIHIIRLMYSIIRLYSFYGFMNDAVCRIGAYMHLGGYWPSFRDWL